MKRKTERHDNLLREATGVSWEGCQEKGPSRSGPEEAVGAREHGTLREWKILTTGATAMILGKQTERRGRRQAGTSLVWS